MVHTKNQMCPQNVLNIVQKMSLLKKHMSTSITVRVHAKEVWDKSDKD